jgi:hypothetical protein
LGFRQQAGFHFRFETQGNSHSRPPLNTSLRKVKKQEQVHTGEIAGCPRSRFWDLGNHEPPHACSSLFPAFYPASALRPTAEPALSEAEMWTRRISLPGRTMVLSCANEEDAGAKKRRIKGEENSGPPLPKTPPLGGWLSR